jgi:acetyltransferase
VDGVDVEKAELLLQAARGEGQLVLDAKASAGVAAAYGLPVPPSALASTGDEAVALAEEFGYPVVLKRIAVGVTHKADTGGVVLGLQDAGAVREAFARVIGPGEQGFVQRMAPEGLEVIVGAQRDAQFGPLLMFGLGGTFVEVLQDVAFRLAPLSVAEAREMIAETAAGKLLAGVRGQPPRDIEAVVQALRRVAQLMVDLPQVVEVDLNPLIVAPAGEGAWAVDARIVQQVNAKE